MKRSFLAVAATAILASCGSYTQSNESLWRDTPDYAAMRQALPPARAYAYGDTTILEFPQGGTPAWIRIRDQAGAAVPFEQLGRYVRIAKPMDRLTAWINGVPREFVVLGVPTQADMPPPPQTLLPAPSTPKRIQGSTAGGTVTLAELRTELEEVRSRVDELQASKSASPQDWRAVTRKLDALEQRMADAAVATLAVQFAYGSIAFRPSPDAQRLIAAALKGVQSINVTGYTDAHTAGPADPRIALGRAMSAKKYLVSNGADAARISVDSKADGSFIADNTTPEGRAQNRRVEIEFMRAAPAGNSAG
ncbi:OmpA family protein [Xenophilus azovorans]|uniref:OmpA family protein n=1 Tax=Xenophilus azovorans TaxID=151755 RepID=UPI0006925AEB|nr:OmpA family protein [Xenophilus azovorans]